MQRQGRFCLLVWSVRPAWLICMSSCREDNIYQLSSLDIVVSELQEADGTVGSVQTLRLIWPVDYANNEACNDLACKNGLAGSYVLIHRTSCFPTMSVYCGILLLLEKENRSIALCSLLAKSQHVSTHKILNSLQDMLRGQFDVLIYGVELICGYSSMLLSMEFSIIHHI